MVGSANFLIDIDSFAWNDLESSRAGDLDNLILAVDKIDEHGDRIYGHPSGYSLTVGICNIYELFTMEDEIRNEFVPWLRHDHQKFLMKLFARQTSPRPSLTLPQLNNEFPEDANGLLRCGAPSTTEVVICDVTWLNFHSNFVNTNLQIRTVNFTYFKQYYKPRLLVAANEIRGLIRKQQVDSIIQRLDDPPLVAGIPVHMQQVHVHFSDGSALNIDGTWKHGNRELPPHICELLVEWGFILPNNYGY
jgi:hypothetical protein